LTNFCLDWKNSLKLVKNISIAEIRRMSLIDDVTFGVSTTKQAPHCLAWAVLARRFGRQAGRQSVGQGQSSKKLHKNLFVFERSCVLAGAALLLKVSKSQKGILDSPRTPKNQRHFVHFFALPSKSGQIKFIFGWGS
jgi:hypothetical protein